MKISHKNTGTIGDFSTSFPILSSLAKIYGPIDITFPKCYEIQYNGFKEFLEYQDFIGKIDFEDGQGDFDLQCHPHSHAGIPYQTYYVKNLVEKNLSISIDIDNELTLKAPFIEIPEHIKNKNIIIDRTKTQVIKKTKLYDNLDENYWINPTVPGESNGDSLFYNINICLQTKKEVIATATGLPIILQFYNIPFTLLQLDNDCILAKNFAYFPEKKIKFINMITNE